MMEKNHRGAPLGNRRAAKPDEAKKTPASFTLTREAARIIESKASELGVSRSAVIEIAVRNL